MRRILEETQDKHADAISSKSRLPWELFAWSLFHP
jgi:hypothetical protein